jgi:hypothetical protein
MLQAGKAQTGALLRGVSHVIDPSCLHPGDYTCLRRAAPLVASVDPSSNSGYLKSSAARRCNSSFRVALDSIEVHQLPAETGGPLYTYHCGGCSHSSCTATGACHAAFTSIRINFRFERHVVGGGVDSGPWLSLFPCQIRLGGYAMALWLAPTVGEPRGWSGR